MCEEKRREEIKVRKRGVFGDNCMAKCDLSPK